MTAESFVSPFVREKSGGLFLAAFGRVDGMKCFHDSTEQMKLFTFGAVIFAGSVWLAQLAVVTHFLTPTNWVLPQMLFFCGITATMGIFGMIARVHLRLGKVLVGLWSLSVTWLFVYSLLT